MARTPPKSFAALVSNVLDQCDFTLAELGTALGVARHTVWMWKDGRRIPIEPGLSVHRERLERMLLEHAEARRAERRAKR